MYSLKASSDLVPFSLKIVNSLKKKKELKITKENKTLINVTHLGMFAQTKF